MSDCPNVQVEPENLLVTTLKQADHSLDMILRLVEFEGREVEAEITLPEPVRAVAQVNLLEMK